MPDGPLPSPHDVTWEQLRDGAEASWPLEGPSSQGGTTLYCYRGWLFVVGYGEHSALPGGAEQILSSRPDDAAGFPPALPDGHAAGCVHDEWRGADWWRHRTCLLELQGGVLRLFERAEPVWTCPAETLLRDDSAERADVLGRLGPAVLDEALRCLSRSGR
jgi:hypothetical protein